MSSLVLASLVQTALLLPVVLASAWSWHRYSAPLLLDAIDGDEMVVGAVHRLSTVTYLLLALGFMVQKAPDRHDVTTGLGAAVVGNWATVVFCLGLAQAVALLLLMRRRRQREQARLSPRVWGPLPAPPLTLQAPPAFGTPPRSAAPPFYAPAYAAPWSYTAPIGTTPVGTTPLYSAGPNPWAWPPTYAAPVTATAPPADGASRER